MDEGAILYTIKVDMSQKIVRRKSDQFNAHRW